MTTISTIFMILCAVGVPVVITGMILDDVTYWFVADMYFIVIFASSALVFYKKRKSSK